MAPPPGHWRGFSPLTSVSSHALGSGWSDLFKLDLDLSNEERASQGLSGKAAGLYKRAAGRILALGVRRGSLEGLFWFPPVLAETAHLENYGGRR